MTSAQRGPSRLTCSNRPEPRGSCRHDRCPDPHDAADGGQADEALWPSADYHRQVERLRGAVGETLYLVELVETEINLAVHIGGKPYVLLGVIDFPRPDPAKGLTPHCILLDDGRGVNLGRVARISRCPFAPGPEDLLYLDRVANQTLLFGERRFSAEFLAQRSRLVLGQCLGYQTSATQALPGTSAPSEDDAP